MPKGFDLAQSRSAAFAPRLLSDERSHAMPAETILVVSLIVLAFTIFMATLFYGDYISRPSRR
jgi:hypothetical protein